MMIKTIINMAKSFFTSKTEFLQIYQPNIKWGFSIIGGIILGLLFNLFNFSIINVLFTNFIFLIILLLHIKGGLESIIYDYIHSKPVKTLTLNLVKILLFQLTFIIILDEIANKITWPN